MSENCKHERADVTRLADARRSFMCVACLQTTYGPRPEECAHENARAVPDATEGPIGGPRRPMPGTGYHWPCPDCLGVFAVAPHPFDELPGADGLADVCYAPGCGKPESDAVHPKALPFSPSASTPR